MKCYKCERGKTRLEKVRSIFRIRKPKVTERSFPKHGRANNMTKKDNFIKILIEVYIIAMPVQKKRK